MEALSLAPRAIDLLHHGDAIYLSSPTPLREPPPTLAHLFREAALRKPNKAFLLERLTNGDLRTVTYSEALTTTERIAGWLQKEKHTRVAALSGNSIGHAFLMLASFLAGIPFVPVSPAYSLLSQDFAKLHYVLAKTKPSLVYTETADFRGRTAVGSIATITANDLPNLNAPFAPPDVTPDHIAKILFTSGSTGTPKGVPNTHRMLCANQQQIAQCWPFLGEEHEDVALVDWLPWSHTFGGNHNFNLVLFHGGTLLIDEGRPTNIAPTLLNLRAMPPTLYFNVPAGYAALVPQLEQDPDLARTFFSRLRVCFYAAAALPDDLWQRLTKLATDHNSEVFLTTAWGSTETSPLATSTHFRVPNAGNIGLPAPGVILKLVPNGERLEVRVKGPNVMTAYFDEPELTRTAFDEEGFYKMGDALKLADPEHPSAGLLFDGRVAEDFKLSTGTWVSVSTVRTGIVAEARGVLQDVVVCGHDRDHIALLAWPSVSGCSSFTTARDMAALSVADVVREHVRDAVLAWNRTHPASSLRVGRILLLGDPPDIDAGEITDKGYINQRAARDKRAAAIADVYAGAAGTIVLA
jgi:feruloyl-CoA synthase